MNILQKMKLYTIPIISFNENKKIESCFSGCLLLFRGFLFILSVAHGIKSKNSKVAIIMHNLPMLHNIPNWYCFNPTRLKQFRTKYNTSFSKILIKILKLFKLKIDYTSLLFKHIGGIDFMSSIVFLNNLPIHSLPLNSELLGQWKYYFNQNQIKEPNTSESYSFYGMTNFRTTSSSFLCDEIFATNISFIETKGFYHRFQLKQHFHELKGCSGSPIVDNNGNLISLVIKKDKIYNDIVYGINLKMAELSFHQEVNAITGEEKYG